MTQLPTLNVVYQSKEGYVFLKIREFLFVALISEDRLSSLVVRVPGYRSRSLGFDSRRYKIL
jgi:hypothetical protein